jgi:kynurenine formamidase
VADYKSIGSRLSNWGRWGDDDERGTLNLLTRERVAAAAAAVRTGKVFDLGIPFDASGPQFGSARINPVHMMSMLPSDRTWPDGLQVADDWIIMPLQAGTQWDALSHVSYDGRMYNGFSVDEITADAGAKRLGIEKLSPIVGRGVLLDIARHRGVDWLGGGEGIGPEELDDAASAQGVEIRAGDILLVRTGWWAMYLREGSPEAYMASQPGLTQACAEWIHDRDLAALGCDNWGVEVQPSDAGDAFLPLHCILIRDMGMPLGEILDLEELAADCADDGVWEFLFSAPPLKVTNGVGSPINPVAVK